MTKESKPTTSVALFQEKTVRRVWYEDRWFFSIIDVVAILTDSPNPRRYWSDLKRDLEAEGYAEVYAHSVQLKMEAPDGKMRVTDAADTRTLLRIIQSIRSPKADPLKQWLAEVGSQRIEEIENPELAMERMRALYEAKGYPKDWIEKRMRGIAVRNELTEEWEERGAQEGLEYAILTNDIAQATFGMGIQDETGPPGGRARGLVPFGERRRFAHHRDHRLERTSARRGHARRARGSRDRRGDHRLPREAGDVAGNTRRDIEKRTDTNVVSSANYLHLTGSKKNPKRLKVGTQDTRQNEEEKE